MMDAIKIIRQAMGMSPKSRGIELAFVYLPSSDTLEIRGECHRYAAMREIPLFDLESSQNGVAIQLSIEIDHVAIKIIEGLRKGGRSTPSPNGKTREQRLAEPDSKLKAAADKLARQMQCNCDLDNWQPERSTGHSWVCRIHKAAVADIGRGPG